MPYNYPEVPTDFEAMTYRLDEARRQGEISNQLDQAGIVQLGWFSHQGRRAMNRAGNWTITVCERLEREILPTPSV